MSNNSFIFYESWSEFIDELDREDAKELVYQIYRVGLDKPMDTNDKVVQKIVKAFILPNIKGAKRRYNTAVVNGKKSEGRPPVTTKEQDNLIWELYLEGLTYDEIVSRCDTYGFSISKNTVGSRIRKRRAEEEEKETKTKNQKLNPSTETNNETNINTFKNKSNSNLITDSEEDDEEDDDEDKEQPLHYKF